MQIFELVVSTLFTAIWEFLKIIPNLFNSLLPTASFFNTISSAFSYSNIICYLIGIPLFLAPFVIFLIRRTILKKSK